MEEYKAFNKAMKEFSRNMAQAYPQIPELKLMIIVYKIFKTISKKKPQRFFMEITKDCQEAIMNKDEQAMFATTVVVTDPNLLKLQDAVYRNWTTFTPEDKEAIWQHLQVLVILARKCPQKN